MAGSFPHLDTSLRQDGSWQLGEENSGGRGYGTEDSLTSMYSEQVQQQCQRWKHAAAKVMSSQHFETLLGFIIMLNMAVVVLETDAEAAQRKIPAWMRHANQGFLGIYIIELLVRLYLFELGFFRNIWNLLDVIIVGTEMVIQISVAVAPDSDDAPSVSFLRLFRAVRHLRALRILIAFPELYMLLHGMYSAIKTLMWGCFLIALMMIMYSIVAVEIIHPLNIHLANKGEYDDCERCSRAFSSVWMASITFFQQLIAGDSWGALTIPLIENYPWLAIPLLWFFFTITTGMLNLILAVIVERAAEERQQDLDHLVKLKEQESRLSKKKLQKFCEDLDKDKNGSLTFEEIKEGFKTQKEFAYTLKSLDISKDQLKTLFEVMDTDDSGAVDYKEFIEKLYDMRSRDLRILIEFLHHQVKQQNRHMKQLLKATVQSNGKYGRGSNLKLFDSEGTFFPGMMSSMKSTASDIEIPPGGESPRRDRAEIREQEAICNLRELEQLTEELLDVMSEQVSRIGGRASPPCTKVDLGSLTDTLPKVLELSSRWLLLERITPFGQVDAIEGEESSSRPVAPALRASSQRPLTEIRKPTPRTSPPPQLASGGNDVTSDGGAQSLARVEKL